jgi:hypothetical protein
MFVLLVSAPEQRFGTPDAPSCGGYTEIGRSGVPKRCSGYARAEVLIPNTEYQIPEPLLNEHFATPFGLSLSKASYISQHEMVTTKIAASYEHMTLTSSLFFINTEFCE